MILKDLFNYKFYYMTLHAFENSPEPADLWFNSTETDRLSMINSFSETFKDIFKVISAKDNGFVIVRLLTSNLSAEERGTILLDFEYLLKINLDESISVWCEPLGDKNSLRNLRGIEVKIV